VPKRRLVVLSPHLDDAALSLGATIAYASEAGLAVTLLTVFAGDPDNEEPAGTWDTICGFTTAGEAARVRRAEDATACEILGADPVWLPFPYGDMGVAIDDNEIWRVLEPRLGDAAAILMPGHPLLHPDHVRLTSLVSDRISASTHLGFYVEQPYANWSAIGRGDRSRSVRTAAAVALRTQVGRTLQEPPRIDAASAAVGLSLEWCATRALRRHRRAKVNAIRAYRSQFRKLDRRLILRIHLYERGWGGEGIGLPWNQMPFSPRKHGVPVWDVRELLPACPVAPR
jgi:LmbE family N-acetylglucosaminyl deacetylase